VVSSSAMPSFYGKNSADVKAHIPQPGWNHFRMGKVPTTPRQRLARNLKALIDFQEVTVYGVAEDAKVDPKTVYNMLKGSFDPRLSIVEKLANVFGLTTWQLLAVDLESRPPEWKQALTLLELYSQAQEGGRKAIMQVAEIASQKAPD
jgi:transcriptional regulator with XRE-family HTH domain